VRRRRQSSARLASPPSAAGGSLPGEELKRRKKKRKERRREVVPTFSIYFHLHVGPIYFFYFADLDARSAKPGIYTAIGPKLDGFVLFSGEDF
jgi:hypothetical protein